MAWSGTLLGLVFLALKATGFLRISKQAEAEGLDLHEFSPKPSPKMVKPQPVIEEVNC
jgi:ammonia channel protein AmtB